MKFNDSFFSRRFHFFFFFILATSIFLSKKSFVSDYYLDIFYRPNGIIKYFSFINNFSVLIFYAAVFSIYLLSIRPSKRLGFICLLLTTALAGLSHSYVFMPYLPLPYVFILLTYTFTKDQKDWIYWGKIFHVSIYFFSGLSKILTSGWSWPIKIQMNNLIEISQSQRSSVFSIFFKFDHIYFLEQNSFIFPTMAIFILIFELFSPLALFNKYIARFFILIFMTMHLLSIPLLHLFPLSIMIMFIFWLPVKSINESAARVYL